MVLDTGMVMPGVPLYEGDRQRFRETGRVVSLTISRDGRERVVRLKLRLLV